jgi:large subunit ribosomal protein L15
MQVKKRKRIGRGRGSGHGKTSCRGHRGQKCRSGGGVRPGFEGGQMPLIRRLPKRGFTARLKIKYQIINIRTLDGLKESTVTPQKLKELKIVKNIDRGRGIKVLGEGELSKPMTIRAHAFSRKAIEKTENAGGKTEIIKSP